MDRLTCLRSGKEISSKPCPHCGSNDVHIDSQINDTVGVKDDFAITIVKEPSQLTIEKDGTSHPFIFPAGLRSKEIVTASLLDPSLNQATPPYVQVQLVQNISSLERFVEEHPTEQTKGHSFTINLGFIKYQYKRGSKTIFEKDKA